MIDVNDHLYYVAAKSRLFHIYNTAYPPVTFNRSGAGDRRFDPITNGEGIVIPSFYLSEHYIDAIAETLMRKVHNRDRVFKGTPSNFGLLQIDVLRRLTLVDVSSISELAPLLQLGGSAYPTLTAFSEWLAVNYGKIDGVTWYGYQRGINGHRCMMLFGDRVSNDMLKIVVNEPLVSDTAVQKLKDASIALDCELPETLLKR